MNTAAISNTRQYIDKLQALTCQYEGVPYLAYQPNYDSDFLRECYGEKAVEHFLEEKHALDPEDKFKSGLISFLENTEPRNTEPQYLRKIGNGEKNRNLFEELLKINLKNLNPQKTLESLDETAMSGCLNDKEMFKYLESRVGEMRKAIQPISFYYDLQTLLGLRHDMIKSARAIISEYQINLNQFNNKSQAVEIGSDKRYGWDMTKDTNILRNNVISMSDAPSFADHMHHPLYCLSKRSNQFVKINYNRENDSAFNNVKNIALMICFGGLHHFSEKALQSFLTQAAKKMQENGILLLVEHDIEKTESNMQHIVHSMANLANRGDELGEIRNFKKLSEWELVLETYNFIYITGSARIVRDNDPSCNTMMAFIFTTPTH